MKFKMRRYLGGMYGFDMFAHPVGVNYKGADNYPTKLSSIVSIALIVMMVINLIQLIIGYQDGSKQIEKTTFEQFDRFSSEAYYLEEQDFEIAAFVTNNEHELTKNHLTFIAYQ